MTMDDSMQGRRMTAARMTALMILVVAARPARAEDDAAGRGWALSVETDPVFWVATTPNGPGIDLNVDLRLRAVPRLRFGVLGYSGTWRGAFARLVILTDDFAGDAWQVQWNGAGVEAQYQLGRSRGGLLPGLRLQWNQFRYSRDGERGQADHLVLTPQLGFQWFPSPSRGFYLLPWAGVQVPVAGTGHITTSDGPAETRRIMPIITAHVGWEL